MLGVVTRAGAAFLVLLLLTVNLAATPGAAQTTNDFTWEAPAGTRGALALRVTFTLAEPAECTYQTIVSGKDTESPVMIWEERKNAQSESSGAFLSIYTAQAHHPDIDTREIVTSGGMWSLNATTTGPWDSGFHTYTLVGPEVHDWTTEATGYHAPMRLSFNCDAPFAVSDLQAGREAVGFSADHMSGGTGASVDQIFGGVAINDGDSVTTTFTEPQVSLRTSQRNINSITMGEARLSHPQGEASWAVDGSNAVHFDGTAGAYTFELDRIAAGAYQRFTGIMYGLHPVASFEEVL